MGYEEKPNYDFFRSLFRQLYKREGFDKEEPILDWVYIMNVSSFSYFIEKEVNEIGGKKKEKGRIKDTIRRVI